MRRALATAIHLVKRAGSTLLVSGILCAVVGAGLLAQTESPLAIRVETDEAVIPVIVLDRTHRETTPTSLLELDEEITDLRVSDFHVFEDGVEQPVEHAAMELPPIQEIQNNVSQHIEESFTPRGIWSSPDLRLLSNTKVSLLSMYLVSYKPRATSFGSCHGIKVRVRRRHATVYARDEYCNTRHPISDPLDGTRLGRQMQEYVESGEGGAIPVYVQAGSFPANGSTGRVDVAVEFEASAIKRKWKRVNLYATVAVLGMVRDKNGRVVARFSDLSSTAPWNFYRGPLPPERNFLKSWELAGIPGRYETQMQLAAGEYDLDVVVTDGEKLGKAKIPVRVERVPQSTLSDIVLCKRFHPVLLGLQAAARPPQYVPLASSGMEFTPTGDTRFDRNQRLIAYFEVYDGLLNVRRAGNFRIRVANAKSGDIKLDAGQRTVESDAQHKRSIPIAAEMAIDRLSPGAYVIEVEVMDLQGLGLERRSKEFVVE